jgi:hypothetical protein
MIKAVSWGVVLCSLVEVYWCFGGASCFHHQTTRGRKPKENHLHNRRRKNLVPHSVNAKMFKLRMGNNVPICNRLLFIINYCLLFTQIFVSYFQNMRLQHIYIYIYICTLLYFGLNINLSFRKKISHIRSIEGTDMYIISNIKMNVFKTQCENVK